MKTSAERNAVKEKEQIKIDIIKLEKVIEKCNDENLLNKLERDLMIKKCRLDDITKNL